jgi:hypothetical protein
MKIIKHCESCHMPICDPKDFGNEADGSVNSDYCWHCYQNGLFTNPFMTLQDMQNHVRHTLERLHEDERVIHYVIGTLPDLKRWYRPQKV